MDNKKCIHMIEDGAGTYCGLKPMDQSPDERGFEYPHKFKRTDCYGRRAICKFKEDYEEATQ